MKRFAILLAVLILVCGHCCALSPFKDLDEWGRVSPVTFLVNIGTLADGEREPLSTFSPSGFQSISFDFLEGGVLYNRCHMIAWQLCGLDDERNLFTGTRRLNQQMIKIENQIADFVRSGGGAVLYTVEPRFQDDELVCRGISFRARSVASDALFLDGFIANTQPGVMIDYRTGFAVAAATETHLSATPAPSAPLVVTYVLNTNTKRFHLPSCPSVDEMKRKNRQEYYGDRETLIQQGYQPCGRCHP